MVVLFGQKIWKLGHHVERVQEEINDKNKIDISMGSSTFLSPYTLSTHTLSPQTLSPHTLSQSLLLLTLSTQVDPW